MTGGRPTRRPRRIPDYGVPAKKRSCNDNSVRRSDNPRIWRQSDSAICSPTLRASSFRALMKHGKPQIPGSTVTHIVSDFAERFSETACFLCSLFGAIFVSLRVVCCPQSVVLLKVILSGQAPCLRTVNNRRIAVCTPRAESSLNYRHLKFQSRSSLLL